MTDHHQDLSEYLLRLADNAMISGQRLCQWCGHAPALEEEMALLNVGLDLFGQARNWYEYAAELLADGRDADQLAFRRDERAFRNTLLVEQPNGDYAVTTAKLFLFDAWHFHTLSALSASSDARIAAIAAKGLKEVTYHLRRSGEWIERLGDGTEESHRRMLAANDELWRFTGDLLAGDEIQQRLARTGIAADSAVVAAAWQATVEQLFERASLPVPPPANYLYLDGKQGLHTEHLGILLAEMQFLQRAYPDATW
ncbi:phenylacetate-CoA oxygenase subunit PaaC [Pseudomonas sp. MAP12]|uniref:Phenylacetate-CoA oxygenase subunit PaaC n=1 Tax=Geopseudomonas aromaticivorans TaxID=2849492 RepID=A0ABS6N1Z7_9GAMM|nr:1,2-phenylacetyl-CoA epoxidase subunit PaaC [Pseudomonas aromaticivorans]MBV2135083.1 phenylacetate-CoA oxygenase subunit PaaC [Pseudomonas aromaticivorans]